MSKIYNFIECIKNKLCFKFMNNNNENHIYIEEKQKEDKEVEIMKEKLKMLEKKWKKKNISIKYI